MRKALLLMPLLLLAGCSADSDTADLRRFVDDTMSKPRGRIEPIPVFKPYEFFSYSATALRSPFELPVLEDPDVVLSADDNVAPDMDRLREQLEEFPMSSLKMVGTMKGADRQLWALVADGNGKVHRVKEGNYMGQNHGRIVSITEQRISLIEIAPNGKGQWLERPHTLTLSGLVGE